MATKDEIIKNFSSLRSLKICLIRLGLKLKMKKKIRRYQPQNFVKKTEISIITFFIHVAQEKAHWYDNLSFLPLSETIFAENN